MNEYIVRSGLGYVFKDRGLELPLMTSDRSSALPHSFPDSIARIRNMRELHGIDGEACLLTVPERTCLCRKGKKNPKSIVCLGCWKKVPSKLRINWYASTELNARRVAARKILQWVFDNRREG